MITIAGGIVLAVLVLRFWAELLAIGVFLAGLAVVLVIILVLYTEIKQSNQSASTAEAQQAAIKSVSSQKQQKEQLEPSKNQDVPPSALYILIIIASGIYSRHVKKHAHTTTQKAALLFSILLFCVLMAFCIVTIILLSIGGLWWISSIVFKGYDTFFINIIGIMSGAILSVILMLLLVKNEKKRIANKSIDKDTLMIRNKKF